MVHELCCTFSRFSVLIIDFLCKGVVLGWISTSEFFTVCRLLVAVLVASELRFLKLAFFFGGLFARFDSVDLEFLAACCSC